jgi:hypothetical protein
VANDYKTANIERVLVALEQIRTSPDDMLKGWGDELKAKFPLLRRELSLYMLRRLKQGLDIPDNNWAADWLANIGPTTTVISMNYDNIAERILSWVAHDAAHWQCPHCRMRALLRKACSCEGRDTDFNERDWRGTLLKPHGSIAWKRCINSKCCSYECLVADENCRPFEPCCCPICREDCEPVLVMPTMSKSLSEMPEISAMWKAARLAVTEAESIAFFGFSMPTSDELLVQMFRSAISVKRKLKRVAAIDLNPDSVLSRFSECVPRGCEVSYVPFKVTPGEHPDWLAEDEGDNEDGVSPIPGTR